MPADQPALTPDEARRRARKAREDLERGRPIAPAHLGDLINAVEVLADQFERGRRELAEVQAEYVQMEYVHLSLVETWNKVITLLPRVGLQLQEHQDGTGNSFSFRWDMGPSGAGFASLPAALEAALIARLEQQERRR